MTIEEIEGLLGEAKVSITKGNFKEAERIAQEVLASTEGSSILYLDALLTLANSAIRLGNYDYGHAKAEQARILAIQFGRLEKEAIALNVIGTTFMNLFDTTKALEYFFKSMSKFEEVGHLPGISGNLGNIGLVYMNLSDYTRALEFYNKALVMNRELEFNNSSTGNKKLEIKNSIAGNLGNIGSVFYNLSDYQRALEYYQDALDIYQEIGSKDGLARNMGNIGMVYQRLNDTSRALEYHLKALEINTELDRKSGIAINLGNIGTAYSILSKYEQSLKYFQRSLTIEEQMGNRDGIGNNLCAIGSTYVNLFKYSQALECFHKALAIFEDTGRMYSISINLGSIGKVYATQSFEGYDALQAEKYLLKAIDIDEQLGTKQNLYTIYQSIAELYENEKKWEKSVYYFNKYNKVYIEVQNDEVKKQADKFAWERKITEMENEREIELLKTEAEKALLNETILHQKNRLETQAFEVENSIQELVKKNGLLQQIQSDIKKIVPHTLREGIAYIEQLQDRVSRHITPLDSVKELDKQWTVIHSCFINKLQQSFPDLTTMELKIAVLLNLKFTSSNIGSALFLAKRTVEFHRHNLRKKMRLDTNIDIYIELAKYVSL